MLCYTLSTKFQGALIHWGRRDNIANIMGIPGQRFLDIHDEPTKELARHLKVYVKNLRDSIQRNSNQVDELLETPDKYEITVLTNGYPFIPTTIPLSDLTKGPLIRLLRSYLNCHYSE